MEEITGSALLMLLTFVTPALPFFIALRFILPKNRTILSNDFTVVLLGCFFSLFVNAKMFAFVGHELVHNDIIRTALGRASSEPLSWEQEVIRSLFSLNAPPQPIRPMLLLIRWWSGLDVPSLNAVTLLLDLHARTAIVAVLLALITKGVTSLEDYLLYLPYSKSARELKWAKRLGISMDMTSSRYLVEKTDRYPWGTRWLFSCVEWFRETFYDPWAYITHYFPRREFLVVDVLTEEGSLYSGVLVYWVPKEDGIAAISLQYILRYFPDEKQPAPPSSPWGTATPSRHRKKSFIKNNGELTISGDQILTIHIWEVRRRCEPDILIRSKADMEIFKWILVLVLLKPDYFEQVRVHFEIDANDRDQIMVELFDWMDAQKISGLPENFFKFIGL